MDTRLEDARPGSTIEFRKVTSGLAVDQQLADMKTDRSGRPASDAAFQWRGPAKDFPLSALRVRQLLRVRSLRRTQEMNSFLDWPSWDMLLDLAATRLEGQHVSVSSLCLSSGAPQSTALRKLSILEDRGLITRYSVGKDRRRICLALTEDAMRFVSDIVREDVTLLSRP